MNFLLGVILENVGEFSQNVIFQKILSWLHTTIATEMFSVSLDLGRRSITILLTDYLYV